MIKNLTLWTEQKSTLEEAIDEFIGSFYKMDAWQYSTWEIGYSGGKDSTALVTLLAYLFAFGILEQPKRLVVHYSDTGMEVPPLQQSALAILKQLEHLGFETQVVRPDIDHRWFVYMLGRGVSLPSNGFRYCTRNLKADPMARVMEATRNGEKVLLLTGVREGESVQRDDAITAMCSKDGGECGQGYIHVKYKDSKKADPLAPLRRWRVCHIFDWLDLYAPSPKSVYQLLQGYAPRFVEMPGFDTSTIAAIYGDQDAEHGGQAEGLAARTGCMQCPLVTDPKGERPRQDKMLDRVVALPQYAYLAPLLKLLDVYVGLSSDERRLRRKIVNAKGECRYPKGPLTLEARRWGLAQVKAIVDEVNMLACEQGQPEISLISPEEEARILELIEGNTWPNGWTGNEPLASEFLPPDEIPIAHQGTFEDFDEVA